jgi:hypothetical protein
MQKLYSKEAIGSHGTFKMEINVDASKLPNLDVESIRYAAHDAADLIEQAVMAEVIKTIRKRFKMQPTKKLTFWDCSRLQSTSRKYLTVTARNGAANFCLGLLSRLTLAELKSDGEKESSSLIGQRLKKPRLQKNYLPPKM